jgi:hypothetical protein
MKGRWKKKEERYIRAVSENQQNPELQLEKKRKKPREKKSEATTEAKGVFFARLLFACSRRAQKAFPAQQ